LGKYKRPQRLLCAQTPHYKAGWHSLKIQEMKELSNKSSFQNIFQAKRYKAGGVGYLVRPFLKFWEFSLKISIQLQEFKTVKDYWIKYSEFVWEAWEMRQRGTYTAQRQSEVKNKQFYLRNLRQIIWSANKMPFRVKRRMWCFLFLNSLRLLHILPTFPFPDLSSTNLPLPSCR